MLCVFGYSFLSSAVATVGRDILGFLLMRHSLGACICDHFFVHFGQILIGFLTHKLQFFFAFFLTFDRLLCSFWPVLDNFWIIFGKFLTSFGQLLGSFWATFG